MNRKTIARFAIERHLGDVVTEEHTAEMIYDEAFAIAHDALLEDGTDPATATEVASKMARELTGDSK